MLGVRSIIISDSVTVKLGKIDKDLRDAIFDKLGLVGDLLQSRVRENLSGPILNRKSGELWRSIQHEEKRSRWSQTARVFVDPATPKAFALEYGGKNEVIIEAKNKSYLVFFWEKEGRWFKGHPGQVIIRDPEKAYGYLSRTLEECAGEVYEILNQAVEELLK